MIVIALLKKYFLNIQVLIVFALSITLTSSKSLRKNTRNFSTRDDESKTAFTLEEYFSGYFSASSFNGSWLSGKYFAN